MGYASDRVGIIFICTGIKVYRVVGLGFDKGSFRRSENF